MVVQVKLPAWLEPGKIVRFGENQTHGVVHHADGSLIWVDWMFGNNLLGATDDEVRKFRSVVNISEIVAASPPYPEHVEVYVNALQLRGLI
jgi:hypothetical protein